MYQQWLQVIGIVFDGVGFALIALEWFRGYMEMRKKVTLVARNQEQAEKFRLRKELKDAIGSVGVAEVGPLYNDDEALAEMAEHVFEMQQVDLFAKNRAVPFFAGVAAFVIGMLLQLAGTWPGCCAAIGVVPQSMG
jgi:hypothetical protein